MQPDVHAPPVTMLKPAANKRKRGHELVDPNDARYPRPSLFGAVRWVLRLWWVGALAYGANILGTLVPPLINGTPLDESTITQALLLGRVLPLLQHAPYLVVLLVVALVIALILAGRWAHHDQQHEHNVLAERQRLQEQAAERERRRLDEARREEVRQRELDERLAAERAANAEAARATAQIHARETATAVVQEHIETLKGAQTEAEPQGPPFDLASLPDPPDFVGRDEELRWLLDRLRPASTQDPTAAPVAAITALGGIGGIGKTALAARAIHLLRDEDAFPGGIAVVLCENKTDALELLREVLSHFDPLRRLPQATSRPALDEKARDLLGGGRALVVLDNVELALADHLEDVVAPLRAASSAILITARQALRPAVVPVTAARELDVLPPDQALLLFARSYGLDGPDAFSLADRAAATRIVEALGGHALALTLAGPYALTLKRPLAELAADLERDPLRISEVGGRSRAVALVLGRSYDALPPDGQRLFAALAAVPAAQFGRDAALALARALPVADAEESVDLLVFRRLAEPVEGDRLRLHPLLRAYAAEHFGDGNEWTGEQRAAASLALATYYANYVNTTSDAGLAADEANITGMLDWVHDDAPEAERDLLVARLCNGMREYWRDRSRTREALRYLPWGIEGAERTTERTGERSDRLRAANISANYGQILANTGQLSAAEVIYGRNLAIRREVQDRQGEGVVLSALGQLALARGQLDAAEGYFQQSLVIRREVQDRQGEGVVLSALGQLALARGQLDAAEGYFQQSLVIRREVQDRQGEGVVLSALGQLALARGQLDAAEGYFQQSLVIDREVQDRQGEGVDLGRLGQIAQVQGEQEEAEGYFTQVLAILRDVQDLQGQGVVLYQLALIAEQRGDIERAETFHRESLQIAYNVQNGQDIADSLLTLGRFLIERRGKRDEGCAMLQQAIARYHEMGVPGEAQARETALELGCDV